MDGIDEARRRIREEKEQKTGKLDLRGLGLSELPPEIGELDHLRELQLGARPIFGDIAISRDSLADLSLVARLISLVSVSCSNTAVTDLGPLAKLTSLEAVNCSHTKVTDLGPLTKVTSLKAVNCSGSEVTDLGPLVKLISLHTVDCSNTKVTDLEPLAGLTSLQTVDCSYAEVADLGPLAGATSLQTVNCSGSQVTDLGPLAGLAFLRGVHCSHSKVTDLGPLAGLTSLQTVNCSRAKVTDLGPLVGLTSLQTVNCSGSQVTDLGPLVDLRSLRWLNCSNTKVTDLGPLAGLTSLQNVDCSFTQVTDLGPLAGLTSLQDVDCSFTQVTDLEPLAGLTSLQEVHCSFTQVTDLGPLAGLTSLQDVDCSGTQVTNLGPLAGLTSLQVVGCSGTQVTDLGPLTELRSLQWMTCSGSEVTDLGPLAGLAFLQSVRCSRTNVMDLGPLAGLTSLQEVDCSFTEVTDLGPLVRLTSLRDVDCSYTFVSDLSPLLDVDKLRSISANGCHLSDLPKLLTARLEGLRLHQTSVPSIPGEVLSHDDYDDCLPRLRAHLVDLEAGAHEVKRAKLVVLGNGRVGKTQLCRQLQGLPFDPSVPSTHGICVSNVPCTVLGPGEELNLWDFGGQDIYHGTHALFMRTHSVFIIVWHPDFEHEGEESRDGIRFRNYPLSYWLDYVRTLGHTLSPVIVVQSRCDHPALEARQLPASTEGFPFLKPCWHSAKAGRGQAALAEAIGDGVRYLREREGVAVIGKGRARVIEILEGWRREDEARPKSERRHRTLSRAEFQQLCENTGGISSPDSLLDYLHQLGVVFHQPGLFLDAIILDQSWALDAVYAVFDREKSYGQITSMGGRFRQSLLDMTVWGDYSSDEQSLFLSLMESAGICFVRRKADPTLGLEAEYVAPDLLPDKAAVADQLSGRWHDGQGARIEFVYPFLHTGLMRGLICDAGKLAADNGVYWKYGVWVYDSDSGSRALIEMRSTGQQGGSISAWVQQGRPERLARWLRERFAEQNRRFGYPDLKPTVDELPPTDERMADRLDGSHKPDDGVGPCEKPMRPVATEPAFGALPADAFPRQGPELFISYAWGDETEEGKRRVAVVDGICAAMASKNIRIHRDKSDLQSGDRIKQFMDRIIEGDLIVAVISDKYLRSPYCMYELFGIFRRCQQRETGFLERVIPVILPDAKIGRPVDIARHYVAHWKEERDELDQTIRDVGVAYVGKEITEAFLLVDEFAHKVGDMLTYLNNELMPRDLAAMEDDGFAEIARLIGKGGKV